MNPSDSGSFMSPASGQAPGTGSALMRLMQLRSQGASPNAVQNPGSSGYVPPAASPTTNAIDPSQLAQAGQPQPQAQSQPAGVQGAPNMTMNPDDAALQLAMGALSNYIKARGEGHMADHGVHMSKANAKVRESQAVPASPVS